MKKRHYRGVGLYRLVSLIFHGTRYRIPDVCNANHHPPRREQAERPDSQKSDTENTPSPLSSCVSPLQRRDRNDTKKTGLQPRGRGVDIRSRSRARPLITPGGPIMTRALLAKDWESHLRQMPEQRLRRWCRTRMLRASRRSIALLRAAIRLCSREVVSSFSANSRDQRRPTPDTKPNL